MSFEWLGHDLLRGGRPTPTAEALEGVHVLAILVGDGVLGSCTAAAGSLARAYAAVRAAAGAAFEVVFVSTDSDAAAAARACACEACAWVKFS